MFLVNTENDGLVEAIGLLEKLGQVTSDGPGTLAQSNFTFKLRGLVFLIGYDTPIKVTCARSRTPASYVVAGHDAMHMVWCQEAVINALAETVRVDWVAEIAIGIDIVIALGGGGHAKLIGRFEVSQDFRISRQLLSSAALPRWHSSTITRSKKSGAYSR